MSKKIYLPDGYNGHVASFNPEPIEIDGNSAKLQCADEGKEYMIRWASLDDFNSAQNGKWDPHNPDNWEIGKAVYLDGRYMGIYVENLTDPGDITESDMERLIKSNPYGYYSSGASQFLPVRTYYYGLRRVFSKQFGSMEQALINFINSPAWINLPNSAELVPVR